MHGLSVCMNKLGFAWCQMFGFFFCGIKLCSFSDFWLRTCIAFNCSGQSVKVLDQDRSSHLLSISALVPDFSLFLPLLATALPGLTKCVCACMGVSLSLAGTWQKERGVFRVFINWLYSQPDKLRHDSFHKFISYPFLCIAF